SRADAGSVIVWPGTWQHIADTNRTRWKRSDRQRELGVMGWCDSFHHCRSRTVHTGHHSIGEHPNTRHCGGRTSDQRLTFGTEHPENPRNRLAYAGCLSVTSYLGYSGRFYATSWRNGRCLSAGHWCITCGTRCNIGHFTYLYSTIVHALSPQYFIISFSVGFSNCNSDRTGGNRKGHDRDNSCLHFYVGGWLHPWLGPTVDNDHDYPGCTPYMAQSGFSAALDGQ